jgi:Complex1_LYR-like
MNMKWNCCIRSKFYYYNSSCRTAQRMKRQQRLVDDHVSYTKIRSVVPFFQPTTNSDTTTTTGGTGTTFMRYAIPYHSNRMFTTDTSTIIKNKNEKKNDSCSIETDSRDNTTTANRTQILSLYRSIRKLHETSLPIELRKVGNTYLRSEFRTLKNTSSTTTAKKQMTPVQYQNFIKEWERYRDQIHEQYEQHMVAVTASSSSTTNQVAPQQHFTKETATVAVAAVKDTIPYGQALPTDIALTSEQQEQLRKLYQEVTTTTTNSGNTNRDNKDNNKLG